MEGELTVARDIQRSIVPSNFPPFPEREEFDLIAVGRAKRQTTDAIRALNALRPATARVLRGGVECEVPVEQVTVGDTVRVRPGERIAVDGAVLEGRSQIVREIVGGDEFVEVETTEEQAAS